MKPNNNMKAYIQRSAAILLSGLALLFTATACSDMLETDSDRQAFDPSLNAKADSVFYAFGIAQAMQGVADQYFFQGEMRGELVATTQYTDSTLSQLKKFEADLSNPYDSAYLYYRVINNCNYYIAHRDTNLVTGSTKVAIPEYAAVLAYRAWAYLQLCRNYGEVPFFTEPLTTISQINQGTATWLDIQGVTEKLAPELLKFTKVNTPNYGPSVAIGTTNHGTNKSMDTRKIFIPAGVILGDLYLECGMYPQAAKAYTDYLIANKKPAISIYSPFRLRSEDLDELNDMANGFPSGNADYSSIFTENPNTGDNTSDIVSYIPMAVSKVNGTTTRVPFAFGYDYYMLSSRTNELRTEERQLEPSEAYKYLTDNQTYYYKYRIVSGTSPTGGVNDVKSVDYGDMRSLAIKDKTQGQTTVDAESEDQEWITKNEGGNIILYRLTTVYLHLAEALNRMGMPDLAFGFLKEGINGTLLRQPWLTEKSLDYLNQTFLADENLDVFLGNSYPIHAHGAGATSDNGIIGSSPYQYDAQVDSILRIMAENKAFYPDLATRMENTKKRNEDYKTYEADRQTAYQQYQTDRDIALGEFLDANEGSTEEDFTYEDFTYAPFDETPYGDLLTQADTIMAIEELLCDEEAMEFCFEGTRWYDLMRFARHKNRAGLPGNAWLADKVKDNEAKRDLTIERNWFLPFSANTPTKEEPAEEEE